MRDVEAREAQNAAEREERGGQRSPDAALDADVGVVDEESGGDAKTDRVREAVELLAESAAAAEAARDTAVHHVEKYRETDQKSSGDKAFVGGKYQRRHSAEDAAARYHIRNYRFYGDILHSSVYSSHFFNTPIILRPANTLSPILTLGIISGGRYMSTFDPIFIIPYLPPIGTISSMRTRRTILLASIPAICTSRKRP
ncbi:hypothetical protein SDC9_139405 [bioreactor metagenome]|uniref:Uncharacterized protein n=1 Tax=bioreactor metagenome TaxID=1076179 RepID=A0A645DS17_9ZZZZ